MLRSTTADLVGRDASIDRLRTAVSSARDGGRVAVIVCGPAGVGKTRLVEEASRQLVGPDDLLMLGHCVDLYGDEIPYGAIADALRDLVQRHGAAKARGLLGPHAQSLAALAGELAPDGGLMTGVRVLETVTAALERLARNRLVWLWLEDLQWADAATRTMLSYLLRTAGPHHLVVTCTIRTGPQPAPAEVTSLVGELLRLPDVDRLDLEPLTRSQVAAQLRSLTGARPGSGVLDRVATLSGGLPFYTELLAADRLDSTMPIPTVLSELVAGQISPLCADSRVVIEAASVEDGRLRHDALRAVVAGDADVHQGVADAVDRGILIIDGDGYRFRHALLRETVANQLLPADKKRWHQRWAEHLDSQVSVTDEPFARIAAAHHWSRAGEPARAFDAALAGAEAASAVMAGVEEDRLLLRLLELWDEVPDAAQRVGVDRGTLVRWTLTSLSSRHELSELVRLIDAERPEDSDPVRTCLFDLIRLDAGVDPGTALVPGLDYRWLRSVPIDNPWLPRAAAYASGYFLLSDPEVAAQLATRAVEAAEAAVVAHRRADHPLVYKSVSPEVDLLFASYAAMNQRLRAGHGEEAAKFYAEILPRCAAISNYLACDADMCQSEALWAIGRHHEALAVATRALHRVAQPRQSAGTFAELSRLAAEAEIALGRWEEASARLVQAHGDLDDEEVTLDLDTLRGVLACWRGDHKLAGHLLDRLRHIDVPAAWHTAWIERQWLSAEIAAARADRASARHALAPIWSLPRPEVCSLELWRPLLLAVRSEVGVLHESAAREQDAARRHLDTCLDVATKLPRIGATGVAWSLHLEAALSSLDPDPSPAPWQAAADAWDRIGQVHESAVARLELARVLLSTGQQDAGAAALVEVGQTAQRIGAAPLARAATALARRANLSPGDDTVAHPAVPARLTARELEVVRRLVEGRSNQQIATELFISPKTASVHVSNILAKLQVTSRTEAAAVAHRMGLTER